MRLLLIILLLPFLAGATNHTATVSGGNVNNVTNAQSTYGLVDEDTLSIPITATGYVGTGNIQASPGHTIYILVPSRIVIDQMELRDLTNVKVICRDATYGYGVWLTNSSGRALLINGVIHNVLVQGVRIYAPADYGLYFTHSRTYDATYGSKNTNLRLDSFLIMKSGNLPNDANAGAIGGGSNGGGTLTGVWDTLKISRLKVDSTYGSQGIEMYNCFHITLRNDSMTHNGGISDTNHLGMFYIRGQLDTAENVYIDDCWGNGFRLNCMALVGSKAAPRGKVIVMNCKIKRSRKYPGIEINNDNNQYDSSSVYLRPCNYDILYCTMGAFKSRQVAGQGSCISAYTHGGGQIRVIGCILFRAWVDNPTQTAYNPTFYNGDGSGAVNDSTSTYYDATGLVYLSDSAAAITRNPGPAVNIGQREPAVVNSFGGPGRPLGDLYTIGCIDFLRYTSHIWNTRRYSRVRN